MKKSIVILIISTIAIFIILSSLVVFASNDKKESKVEDKVSQELEYLDRYLVGLLGDFDGLTIGSYLKEEKSSNLQIESDRTLKTTDKDQGDASDSENSKESSKQNTKLENSNQGNQQNDQIANNKQSNILSNNGKYVTKWDSIQNQIEELYQIWNTVSIDLHSINVDGSSILTFSDFLNKSTQNIKNKDKEKAMESIVELYQLLPKYNESFRPGSKEANMINIQSNIITAYSDASNGKWQDAKKQLYEASNKFADLLNSVNQNFNNQITINQCYVLINELNKAVDLKDKEIFFIQYQNLMGKMETI